jgi:L-threonylcarbamoyladenylate synthase
MLAGPEDIAAAVQRLRAGGLVAFPTETVYGLGADAFNESAVRAVFDLKGRPSINPLIVHVADVDMARRVVAQWPKEADALARAFWPGPLTIVLPRHPSIPALVTAGGNSVAVRCPDHPTTLALLAAYASPLVGPSANPSGRVSPTTAAHVAQAFTPEQVMVLDGGPCRAGIESTVVSLTGPAPIILRPGLIGPTEVSRVLGREVAVARVGADEASGPLESPGLLGSHYAPLAPATLADAAGTDELLRAGARIVLLTTRSRAVAPPSAVIRLPGDARGYAAALYASLREADSLRPTLIVIERPDTTGSGEDRDVWAAVMDRLSRAVTPRAPS